MFSPVWIYCVGGRIVPDSVRGDTYFTPVVPYVMAMTVDRSRSRASILMKMGAGSPAARSTSLKSSNSPFDSRSAPTFTSRGMNSRMVGMSLSAISSCQRSRMRSKASDPQRSDANFLVEVSLSVSSRMPV